MHWFRLAKLDQPQVQFQSPFLDDALEELAALEPEADAADRRR